MSKLSRFAIDAVSLLAFPTLVGIMGYRSLEQRERPSVVPAMDTAAVASVTRPMLDPSKPTVVVLLGTDLTEITDALGPYETFARAGKYNVVTAADKRQPTLLTGGLQILPHYSLAEIDGQVAGGPAVVVVPNLPNADDPINRPVIDWITKQASKGSMIHSWCKGAMALAETGLLDGKTATAHWGDIPTLEKRYPKVTWVRGVRWIDRGQFVMSAGITSGIDASLRVLFRLAGDSVARRVTKEMRYPNYHFALDPRVEQYELQASDLVLLANAAFRVARPTIALALYDGVGELDLSNVYDAHGHLTAANIETIGAQSGPVVTQHGLTVFPTVEANGAVEFDRVIVPGVDGRKGAARLVQVLSAVNTVEYVHADAPTRFGLEPVIADLARTADALSARFALRRMEYRSDSIALGNAFPWMLAIALGAWAVLGLAALRLIQGVSAPATLRSMMARHRHHHLARNATMILLMAVAVACRDGLPTTPENPNPVDPIKPAPVVASVTLNVSAIALAEGGSQQLMATPRDSTGNAIGGIAITWSSSDRSVADVNAIGRIIGVRAGTATLTASANGKSAEVTVSVTASYPYELIYSVRTFDIFRELFRMDLGIDTPGRRLFEPNQWASQPRPSPDGARILYVAPNPIIGDPSIWVANRDGSSSQMIVAFISDAFSEPTWSPDGQKIAYVRSTNDGTTDRSHIWIANADGTNQTPITKDMPGNQSMPAWSPVLPDGTQRIAFVQDLNLKPRIWTMLPDGSGARQLGSMTDAYDIQPAWSPDGRTIAFQRTTASIAGDLWLMNADGSNERALLPLGLSGSQLSPQWSPDGRMVAFTSNHESAATYQIFTVWADGTKLARRTFDTTDKATPAWLPNDR
jgi:AraC family transcriptional regulator, transcriptional activator FtrA